jgi:hypothetical protein
VSSTLVDAPRAGSRRVAIGAGWAAWFGRLGVALAFVAEGLTILRANHAWLVQRVPDDGFYYLEIAQRLARGEGATFDGINQTSGFHPLWELFLTPLARVTGGGDLFVKAALLAALALFAVGSFIVARVLSRATGPATAWVAVLVVVHTARTMGHVIDGMEGAMVVLALALVLLALERFLCEPTARSAFVLGAACAVAVLARMDMLAVIWIVPALAALRCRTLRWLGHWAGGLAAVGLPAAVWWYMTFGHVLSTSATVKSGWLERRVATDYGSYLSVDFVSDWLADVRDYFGELVGDAGGAGLANGVGALGMVIPLLALGGLALALVGARRRYAERAKSAARRSAMPPSATALGIVGTTVVAKAMLDQVTEPDWALAWYSAPARVVVGLCVGVLAMRCVAWLVDKVPSLGVAAAALMAIALLPSQATAWTRADDAAPSDGYFYDQLDLAATWLTDHPQPVLHGAKDAGIVGYRLDPVGVVNIDGLVNDYEFAAFLETDPTILDRIRQEHIEVYVGRLSDQARDDMRCATTLWQSPGHVPIVGGVAPVYVLDTRECLRAG